MLFLEAVQSLSTFFCGPLNESVKSEVDLRTELCTYNCRTARTVWRRVVLCVLFVWVSFCHISSSVLLVHRNESLQKCPCVGDTGWRRWHVLYQLFYLILHICITVVFGYVTLPHCAPSLKLQAPYFLSIAGFSVAA